jgi:hypothetical protein
MREFETKREEATGLRKVRMLAGAPYPGIPPGTLAEILDDVRRGQLFEHALSRFLVEFHTDTDPDIRRMRLEDEPDLAPNPVLNALLGAIGEHFTVRWGLGESPAWTMRPERYLDRPHVMHPEIPESDRFKTSPPAFRSRSIFTDAEPFYSENAFRMWTTEYVDIDLVPTMRL